jgi:hypothetical protein
VGIGASGLIYSLIGANRPASLAGLADARPRRVLTWKVCRWTAA